MRACDLAPGTRLRLECIRLLGRGLTVTEVADLLECNVATVRGAVHRFAAGGFGALADAPRPGRPGSVTREDREVVAALLDESARQGRTWTAAALCDWLAAERGVRVSAAQLTELLHRDGFRWKRTRDTLRHKTDPVLQQAARAQLEDLRQDRRGHAAGVRARGAGPPARWCCRTGQAPAGFTRVRPCTVVLDDACAHVARIFKGRREELAASASNSSTSRPAAPS
ncbi:helix-turn-helix domain-containing protein [Streptomyces sp. NPDC059752]|uniref:helix-turn-helix domain-containing protein n=1 Tax=unclassified Streptomyces TaxID=2593676 RepID=UPI003646F9BC